MMRAIVIASALALAACGQGGPLSAASDGWQLQEVRDELTGTGTQTATRISPFDNGQVELTATCKGEQVLLRYDEWGEVGPVGGTGRVVEFRMTVIPANGDDMFSLANAGTQLGLQSTVPLRASVQEGEEERLVGFVDHINSVTTQVPVAAFYGADAISALRVEIPLLLQSATSGQPPVSQNVVVDLMPQDDSLRTLLNACDPSASQSTANIAPATAPIAPQPAAFTLGSVPDSAVDSGAGCVAVSAAGQNIFLTDYSTAAIHLNGETVRLAIRGQSDPGGGGEFYDVSGRINVRIALTGEPTEAGEELSSTPANLTLLVDGAEIAQAISYQCGS
jgi:hypothetical protein